MRIFKRILLLFVILLCLFIANVLISSGFFRTIEPKFDGEILQKIALKGAEDITISHIDSFALVSSTNRRVFPRTEVEDGGLYLIDLTKEKYEPILISGNFKKSFAPHGISMWKKDSTYHIMAINHTSSGHSIEVFELHKQQLKHLKTLTDDSMIQPNDLVMVDENRFYFTNDHKYTSRFKRLAEDYLGLALSNVIYYDGKEYKEATGGIAYANGINYDAARKLLFVASPRHFLVKVFSVDPNGELTFIEDIDCETGVDNIEFDADGNLWIGSHPNLLRFSAYAKGKKETSPSEIIKITYRNQGDYAVEKVYVSDGEDMSASSVAAPFDNLIFFGNVMDHAFLILKRNNTK
ncbi:MAG: strictosidine synthase family protein [bacterium]